MMIEKVCLVKEVLNFKNYTALMMSFLCLKSLHNPDWMTLRLFAKWARPLRHHLLYT